MSAGSARRDGVGLGRGRSGRGKGRSGAGVSQRDKRARAHRQVARRSAHRAHACILPRPVLFTEDSVVMLTTPGCFLATYGWHARGRIAGADRSCSKRASRGRLSRAWASKLRTAAATPTIAEWAGLINTTLQPHRCGGCWLVSWRAAAGLVADCGLVVDWGWLAGLAAAARRFPIEELLSAL